MAASQISLEKAEHLLATSPEKAIEMLEKIGSLNFFLFLKNPEQILRLGRLTGPSLIFRFKTGKDFE